MRGGVIWVHDHINITPPRNVIYVSGLHQLKLVMNLPCGTQYLPVH